MTDEGVTKQKTEVATPADLAAAREARGMSQVDISQRIKLQVRQVNALEEGEWEALPGKSFVRGALRSYGKLLDVDVAPLLESIGGFAEPTQVSGMRPLDASLSRSSGMGFNGGGRGSPILWVIAGLIGVVALVLYFGSDGETSRIRSWLPSGNAPAGSSSEPVPAPVPAPPSPSSGTAAPSAVTTTDAASWQASSQTPSAAPAAGAFDAAPFTSAPMMAAAAPASSANAAAPSRAPDKPDTSAGAATAATGTGAFASTAVSDVAATGAPNTGVPNAGATSPIDASAISAGAIAASAKGLMRLKAIEDAWVEVRQADGSALHNGLVKAGSSIELSGTPPYRLVLGNANRLELVYEGKVQDLAAHTRANNIAKLQLK